MKKNNIKKKAIITFSFLFIIVGIIFIKWFIYRPPTEDELIKYIKKMNPQYTNIKIVRFDEDVNNTYWYEVKDSKDGNLKTYGIEFEDRLVLPWKNYFERDFTSNNSLKPT